MQSAPTSTHRPPPLMGSMPRAARHGSVAILTKLTAFLRRCVLGPRDSIFSRAHVKRSALAMSQPFAIKTCMPHQQVSGSHVCFLQFSTRPPPEIKEWLLPAIKASGNAYRPGPPGYDSGWHIHDPKEVAKRVHRRWPELAEALAKVARFLRRHPDEVPDHREPRQQQKQQQQSGLDILAEAARGPTRKKPRMEVVKV